MESLIEDIDGKKNRFINLLRTIFHELDISLSKEDSSRYLLPSVNSVIDVLHTANPTSMAVVLSMMLGIFKESLSQKRVPATMVMACPEFTLMLSKVEGDLSSRLFDYLCFFVDAGEFLRSTHQVHKDG
jgi:hypothetical protein